MDTITQPMNHPFGRARPAAVDETIVDLLAADLGFTRGAKIGEGGDGAIYEVSQGDRVRVLKVSAQDLTTEATLHGDVYGIGAYVPDLYDNGRARGLHYMVMDRIRGISLSKRLETGPLDVQTAARIAADLAFSLSACHLTSVLHRDVKPANVIAVHGTAYLLDFGAATLIDEASGECWSITSLSQSEKHSISGNATLQYLSPKRIERRALPVDDYYGLGVVMYEMVAGKGKTPFDSDGKLRDPSVSLQDRLALFVARVDGNQQVHLSQHIDKTKWEVQYYIGIVDRLLCLESQEPYASLTAFQGDIQPLLNKSVQYDPLLRL
jgi:serine/threonine protein kinase